MARTAAAKRYAQAVFELAVERGDEDRWQADLSALSEAFADAGLASFLQSPRVPFVTKQEVLGKSLEGVGPLALNLAYLLVKDARVYAAAQVTEEYRRMLNARRGIETAQVVSAAPLGEGERNDVSAWLAKMTGKKVALEARTEPGIIGGLIVRMGDQLIDASVRTKLEKLKRSLVGAGG